MADGYEIFDSGHHKRLSRHQLLNAKVAGASLSPFTLRFGHLLGPNSTVIQIDSALQPTNPRVDLFVSADVKSAAGRILELLDRPSLGDAWRAEAAVA